MSNLTELSKQFYKTAESKGFWGDTPHTQISEKLMLVVSELGESMEALRKEKWASLEEYDKAMEVLEQGVQLSFFDSKELENTQRALEFETHVKDSFEDEIADSIIRLLDLCGKMDIDIQRHVDLKAEYNLGREKLHGKNF